MDDNMRSKARALFGKEFMNIMKPKAPAKNEAVALQQRANARPIPTYKVGGAVKKPMAKVQKKADGGEMQPKVGIEPYGVRTPQPLPSVGTMTPTKPGFKVPGQPLGGETNYMGSPNNAPTYGKIPTSTYGKIPTSLPAAPTFVPPSAPTIAPATQALQTIASTAAPVMAKKGGKISKNAGLYANINAKRERIAAGSGEKMRKPGSKGAPTDMAFAKSKVSKKADGGTVAATNEDIRNRYRDLFAGEQNGARVNRAANASNRQDRRADREADITAKRAAREAEATQKRTAREAEIAQKRTAREADQAKRQAEAAARQADFAARQTADQARHSSNTQGSSQTGGPAGGQQGSGAQGSQVGSYGTTYGRQTGQTPTRPGFPSGTSSSFPSWAANAGRVASGAANMKKGGKAKMVKEKATGEMYSSKRAMAKHEAAESPNMQRMERKRAMDGGPIAENATASKMQMGQPKKYAQGGAGKVRKGMMTPSGQITPGKPRGRM